LGWIHLAYAWEEWRTVLITLMDIGFLTVLEDLDYLRGSDVIIRNFVPTKKSEGRYFIYILCSESVNIRNTKSFFFSEFEN